jgi:hypothetical protein
VFWFPAVAGTTRSWLIRASLAAIGNRKRLQHDEIMTQPFAPVFPGRDLIREVVFVQNCPVTGSDRSTFV